MSGYRNEDISRAFSGRDGQNRKRSRNDRDGRNRNGPRDGPRGDFRPGFAAVDRSTCTPFLIRVFPYVVMKSEIQNLPEKNPSAPLANTGNKQVIIGTSGISRAYRSPDTYRFVFAEKAENSDDVPEIRVYTYMDEPLDSVIAEVKGEMAKRGLLGVVPEGRSDRVGVSVAAAWEEWHRNNGSFFMRCRSVAKQGMGPSWCRLANAGASGLNVDERGFGQKTDQRLAELGWRVGDAMDMCFIVCEDD